MNRSGFFFLLFAIVVAVTVTWLNSTWVAFKGFAFDQQEKQIDYYLSDFSIVQTYTNGHMQYRLEGEHLVYQQSNKASKIINPRIEAKDVDGTLIVVDAEEAQQTKEDGSITFLGTVYAKKESDTINENFELLTSDLSYNPISRVLSTDTKLTFIANSGKINGVGFSTNLNEQELRIHKHVQAKFIPSQ